MRGRAIELPSRDDLVAEFYYDTSTGYLIWKRGPRAGMPCRGVSSCGYRCVRLGGKHGRLYQQHRIIWKMVYASEPNQIDHINNDKLDNRITNLRETNSHGNGCNKLKTKSNRSNYKGVSWYKKLGKWKSSISKNYKTIHIGYYDTPEEAHAAYVDASVRIHGEFRNSGERL